MTPPGHLLSPSTRHQHVSRIGLLLCAFFMYTVVWSLAISPNSGPDEGSHFEAIRYIASHGKLPVYGLTYYVYDPTRLQVHASQPPLYYVLLAPVYGVLSDASKFWQVMVLRLISVCLGTISLGLLYLLGLQIFPTRPTIALTMAALTGFMPMFTFMNAVVNTDNLINLITLACMNWLLYGFRRVPDRKWLTGLGALLGIGMLTKYSIVPVFITCGVALALLALLQGKRWMRLLFSYGLWTGSMALLISGGMFVRNWVLYKDILNAGRSDINQWTPFAASGSLFEMMAGTARAIPPFLPTLFQSFTGVFDYMEAYMPPALYVVFGVIVLVGGVGACTALRGAWQRRHTEHATRLLIQTLCLLILGASTFAFVCNYSYNLDYQPQGRYLFTGLTTVSAIVAFGWDCLARRLRIGDMAAPFMIIAMVTLNIVALVTTLLPLEHAHYLRVATTNPQYAPQPLSATSAVTIPFTTRQTTVERLDVMLNIPPDYSGDINWKIVRDGDGATVAESVSHLPGSGLTQYRIRMPSALKFQADATYFLVVRASTTPTTAPAIYALQGDQRALPAAADYSLRLIYPNDISLASLQQRLYEWRSAPIGSDRNTVQTLLVVPGLIMLLWLTGSAVVTLSSRGWRGAIVVGAVIVFAVLCSTQVGYFGSSVTHYELIAAEGNIPLNQ